MRCRRRKCDFGQDPGKLVADLAARLAPAGVMCLTGISSERSRLPVDMNRGPRLDGAANSWVGGLISRRVPLSSWPGALTRQPGDIKVTVDLTK